VIYPLQYDSDPLQGTKPSFFGIRSPSFMGENAWCMLLFARLAGGRMHLVVGRVFRQDPGRPASSGSRPRIGNALWLPMLIRFRFPARELSLSIYRFFPSKASGFPQKGPAGGSRQARTQSGLRQDSFPTPGIEATIAWLPFASWPTTVSAMRSAGFQGTPLSVYRKVYLM